MKGSHPFQAHTISVDDLLCSAENCRMSIDGLPLYIDTQPMGSHLQGWSSYHLGVKYLQRYGNPFDV